MADLHSLPAGPDRPFVCPWCGAKFDRRFIASDGVESLEEHWRASAICSTHRAVNNPTQSKYDVVDHETGLRLVDREDRDA
jgi:hypothetical protein